MPGHKRPRLFTVNGTCLLRIAVGREGTHHILGVRQYSHADDDNQQEKFSRNEQPGHAGTEIWL